jgi:hypothetical protein
LFLSYQNTHHMLSVVDLHIYFTIVCRAEAEE